MDVRHTKKTLTTPIKIKIKSADHMVNEVRGIGYSKNQFSPDKFQKQLCIGCANWYEDKIGQEWEVLPFSNDFFRINNKAMCGFYFIDGRDCTIEPPNEQMPVK